ncbi:tRNA pseudouridine(55) synthase TruB [bacterium]|nr:tRNA pseudouridine(55) synthase TruB [bacterium]
MTDDRLHGVLLLNKPVGMSSHDAIYAVRRMIGQKGGGHTGTLDPLAEGLLVICLGRATKISRYLAVEEKTYEATIRLGFTSSTYDSEGVDPDAVSALSEDLSEEQLTEALARFRGEIDQTVPPFSAVQVNGRRLYKDARKGREIEQLPVRKVTIHEIELQSWCSPDLKVTIRCGKGTYIRSLAHDLGQALGCGAYLAGLKRTKLGIFSLDDSLTLDDINRLHSNSELEKHLLPIGRVLPFPAIEISDDLAVRLVQGPPVRRSDVVRIDGTFDAGETVILRNRNGDCLAVGRAVIASDACDGPDNSELFSYDRVLN